MLDEGVGFCRKKWRLEGKNVQRPWNKVISSWFFLLVRCNWYIGSTVKTLSNFSILLSYFQLRYSRDLRILKYLTTVPDKWWFNSPGNWPYHEISSGTSYVLRRICKNNTCVIFEHRKDKQHHTKAFKCMNVALPNIFHRVRVQNITIFQSAEKFQRCLFTISFSGLKWYLLREMVWFVALIRKTLYIDLTEKCL